MPLIRWDNRLSVGIKVFDEQHKRLVSMINELHEAMKTGRGKHVLNDILRKMEEYAKTHFTSEEVIMKKYGFPGYWEHKREHEAFIAKVREFRTKYEKGELTLTFEVMNFLKNWLINHIMGTDKKYGPFLRERGFT